MSRQVIFVHVEKTAGSSITRSLIEANVEDNVRVGGLRAFVKHRTADCIHGHFPYGFHVFTPRPVDYITMFREPLDRAVSWYYFIRDQVNLDLWPRHPLRDFADSVTLVQFYENPRLANMQTRFMAGFAYHKAYPRLHRSHAFQRAMLDAAKRNLHRFRVVGMQEHYDASVELMQQRLGWTAYEPVPPQAKTKKRLSLATIESMNPKVLPALRASQHLDVELFAYAQDVFRAQFAEADALAPGLPAEPAAP